MANKMKKITGTDFLTKYKSLPELRPLLDLRDRIFLKSIEVNSLVESFISLHDDFIPLMNHAFSTPDFTDLSNLKFHCKNYFLMYVYVADEFFFFKNGRKIHLNKNNNGFDCDSKKGDPTDYFNRDYEKSGKVSLSFSSFEGYTHKMENFIKPIRKDCSTIEKVLNHSFYLSPVFIYLTIHRPL